MPPPKEHFFNVRTLPGTSVDEIIDATETLVGLQEIYSVQHHGGFPLENPPLLQKWLDAMRQPGFKPATHHTLCSAHFRPDDFRSGLRKRLLQEGAVPSLFEHPKSSESTH
ncbi:hypothetical protein MTO96_052055, partial [Rhipicephalus appendiculatus]